MATLVTADTHWHHVNIRRHCPARGERWGSVEEMNEALVANWNRVVAPSDTVFHLGDVVMGKVAESLRIIERLNGHKVLVPGNHDRVHSHNRKGVEAARVLYTDAGFEIADEQVQHTIHDEVTGTDTRVLLCHFPYAGDHTEHERYPQHRPVYRGQWLLHGHIHQNGFVDRARKSINVGVDVPAWDFTPVSEQQIADVIAGRVA
jgi:calcineurin-like phosphoesterase family protein